MVTTISGRIAAQLSLQESRVVAALALFDEGATVPFIARYRKERTQELDEEQLRDIESLKKQLEALEERRTAILESLAEQKITDQMLLQQIAAADSLTRLEDLYLPHRPKRKTRASKARELGLEPLAVKITRPPRQESPAEAARQHLGDGVASVDDALAGARDIVAEWAAEDPEVRREVRDKGLRFGRLKVGLRKGAEDPKQTYRAYYEFEGSVGRLHPHQILAIDRGEREKILRVGMEISERDWRQAQGRRFRSKGSRQWAEQLQLALDDSAARLLLPAIERDLRRGLTEKAQLHAIEVFATNLKSLLLVPPLSGHTVLGLDPGFRSGCKVAVVDPTGKLVTTDTIYPHPPQKRWRDALQKLKKLVERHQVSLVAIGNGTASRETEELAAALEGVSYLVVSEAGASVYSASPLARSEFPDLDVSIRGAVSIARRVQDPLAELIKIDPKSVGVGLYQHDLDESRLDEALGAVVETVVHNVGVDLNTASAPLLSHLGGIGPKTAESIVRYRESKGAFRDRESLKEVKGVGPKAFELAAGFLRIRDGEEPLDNTAIHPESYPVARQLMQVSGGRPECLSVKQLLNQLECGEPTLRDILQQLQKPSRDPRLDLPAPLLRSQPMAMEDLQSGQRLQGTVRNVVDFGAFVDVGVKQDGLVHRSKLRGATLSVGEVREFEVLDVDIDRGRISLGI